MIVEVTFLQRDVEVSDGPLGVGLSLRARVFTDDGGDVIGLSVECVDEPGPAGKGDSGKALIEKVCHEVQ